MKFHKEGYVITILVVLFVVVILGLLNIFWPEQFFIHYVLYFASAILLALVIRFFRVPNCKVNLNDNLILSVADGKVVAIEEVEEDEYFHKKMRLISVFMSVNNVHANFYPINGKVTYTKYHPGKFLVAWHPKSSTLNERSSIVIENSDKNAVLFRQIAGFVARRIVTYSKVGDNAIQGSEMGFIKFGSRIDIFVPLDAEVLVKLDEKVCSRITALARFV